MNGFVTDEQTKNAVLAGIDGAMDSRGLPRYWTTGASYIYSGPHAGKWFIPGSDSLLSTPLHGRPPLTPLDFPETQHLLAALGGLDARVEIDREDIVNPETLEE